MDIFDLVGRRPEPDRWRGTVAEEHSGLYRGLEWRRGAVGGQAAETEVRVLGVLKSLTLCPSYTLLSVAAQYLLPLAVITVVYGEIYNFLTLDCKLALPQYDTVTIYFLKDLMTGKRKCKYLNLLNGNL